MDSSHMLCALSHVAFCCLAFPYDLIDETLRPEDFIENCFDIKANVIIEMDVETAVLVEQFMQ
jgi:hypothetical protein